MARTELDKVLGKDPDKPKRPISEEQREHLKNIGFGNRDPEAKRAAQSKGGHVAKENNERRKNFKEALAWALELPAFNSDDELIRKYKKQTGKDLTNRDAMTISLVRQALAGDVKAFVVARDTTGELPAQTVNVQNEAPMVITVQTISSAQQDEDEEN